MAMDSQLLEINLISAQDLKKPPTSPAAVLRRLQTYAVAWVDPATKLRTSVDRDGGENPTWNDKFVFRVPVGFLSSESSSAVHIEIYAVGYLVDSLIGTVRFLIGNQRLLSSAPGVPFFAAVGIRRASGRFQGVLNLATMRLPLRHVSALAAEALARTGATAIAYRDLMAENSKIWRRRSLLPPSPARKGWEAGKDSPRVLKEWNRTAEVGRVDESDGGAGLCGLGVGFHRKIHLSPSDQNLQMSVDPEGENTPD